MFNVEELTVYDANKYLYEGLLSCFKLTMTYLQRIEQYIKKGPKLNAVVELIDTDLLPRRYINEEM